MSAAYPLPVVLSALGLKEPTVSNWVRRHAKSGLNIAPSGRGRGLCRSLTEQDVHRLALITAIVRMSIPIGEAAAWADICIKAMSAGREVDTLTIYRDEDGAVAVSWNEKAGKTRPMFVWTAITLSVGVIIRDTMEAIHETEKA